MQTTDLIERLAADQRPIPARAAWQGLGIALAVGFVVALGAVWVSFGPRKGFATVLLAFPL